MNAFPIVGWLLSFIGNASVAVPFWIIWTKCGLGDFYFGEYLPARFVNLPFWHTVGLFMCASIIRGQVPKLASVSNTNTCKDN